MDSALLLSLCGQSEPLQMTRKAPRKQARPELLRGGFRILFFALFGLAALVSHLPAVIPALVGVGAGFLSLQMARRRGSAFAHSLVCLDYLLLGAGLALAGGTTSWLLLYVPVLVLGQLTVSPRSDWAFLIAPTLLLVIVLAIGDSSLGGNRIGGLAKLFALTAGGIIVAHSLTRPRRQRRVRTQSVDPTTGFYTRERLRSTMTDHVRDVAASHDSLAIVCLKIERFSDTHFFLGAKDSELLVRAIARRIERRLHGDDTAVRVAPDTFVLALPGRNITAARAEAAAMCHDVAAQLINRQRHTMRSGASAFPAVREVEGLLQEAYADMAAAAESDNAWAAQQTLRVLPQAVAQ